MDILLKILYTLYIIVCIGYTQLTKVYVYSQNICYYILNFSDWVCDVGIDVDYVVSYHFVVVYYVDMYVYLEPRLEAPKKSMSCLSSGLMSGTLDLPSFPTARGLL